MEEEDDGGSAKRLRLSDFFSLELAAADSTKRSLYVDRKSVELAYCRELSKQLYALSKDAIESLDRVAKIDTAVTQLNHEVFRMKQDQEQFRKVLSDLESMMKNEAGELWNEVDSTVAGEAGGEAGGTPSCAE